MTGIIGKLRALFLTPLLLPVGIAAQQEPLSFDERYEHWFQIDLIVFERHSPGSAPGNEQWSKNVNLSYPEKLHHLFTEEEWLNFSQPPEAFEDSDTPPLEKPPHQPDTENASLLTAPNDLAREKSNSAQLMMPNTAADTAVSPELPPMEIPFILRPKEESTLSKATARLEKNSRYRILFNKRWRQPLKATELADAVLIRGGETFGEHQELEGSIRFSVDRYLHIDAKLWRSQFAVNYGQENGFWPKLPQPPQPQQKATPTPEDETSLTMPDLDMQLTFDSAFQLNNNSALSLKGLALDASGALPTYQQIQESPYLVEEIITLTQRRRMRSKELHYIDHPRLGILVRITPYEVPLPTASVAIENDASSSVQ